MPITLTANPSVYVVGLKCIDKFRLNAIASNIRDFVEEAVTTEASGFNSIGETIIIWSSWADYLHSS